MPKPAALLNLAYAAHSVDVAAAQGEPSRHIQLLPMGEIRGRDGRGPYRLESLAHAERVVAASLATAGSTQIPIDYDHQIVYGAREGVGGVAPASGWITGLTARDDGIWADVEWTAAASAKLAAREYRYVSPYFGFEKASGRVTRILNAALTNQPNFTELAAVAAADPDNDGDELPMSKIATALGLPADADQDTILAAVNALKAKSETAAAASVDPTKYVPIEAFTELRDSVGKIVQGQTEEKAAAAVDAAVKGGKITPAGREHALALYKADPTAFAAFVGSAPAVLTGEALDTAGARGDPNTLTPEEKAAGAALGLSEESLLKSKKSLMGAN